MKKLSVIIFTIIGVLSITTPAHAHAQLLATSPENGRVLKKAPSEITLEFGEAVAASASNIELLDDSGKVIPTGSLSSRNGSTKLIAKVPSLQTGVYVVSWHALSADGHTVRGAFLFTVGTTASTEKAESLAGELLVSQAAPKSARVGWAITRTLILGLSAVVVGWLLLFGWGWPPTNERQSRRMVRFVAIGGVVISLLLTQSVLAVTQGESLFRFFGWSSVSGLLHTRPGLSILLRFIGFAIAIGISFIPYKHWGRVISVLPGVLIALATTLGGHATVGLWEPFAGVIDLVHVIAISLWFSGLVTLLCVRRAKNFNDYVTTFSQIAFYSVIAIVISGVFASYRQVGSLDALRNTPYGMWLIRKVVLFVAVLFFARIARSRVKRKSGSVASLMVVEVSLLIVVLGITGILSAQVPAREALNQPIEQSATAGTTLVDATIDPGRVGPVELHVFTSTTTGQPKDVTNVELTITNLDRKIGPLPIQLVRISGSHYVGSDAKVPFAGKWRFSYLIEQPSDVEIAEMEVTIKP